MYINSIVSSNTDRKFTTSSVKTEVPGLASHNFKNLNVIFITRPQVVGVATSRVYYYI